MKTNLLGRQEQRSQKDAMTHSYLASQLASMIYWDNQNNYVWGKDRQEDLLELLNESIDWWESEPYRRVSLNIQKEYRVRE